MPSLTIRSFTPPDREAVFRIAADTAFFGDPLEAFLDDRRLFCDAFCRYYTDLEPEHCWVASAEGQVVGYLTGCVDTLAQQRRWARRILPRLASGLLKGEYRMGGKTRRHIGRQALTILRGERVYVDKSSYPAHLHLNIEAKWRHQGLGRRLLEAYLDQLRMLGIGGVHLNTTSRNIVANRLYEHMGFRVVGSRLSRQWGGLVGGEVWLITYAARLPLGP